MINTISSRGSLGDTRSPIINWPNIHKNFGRPLWSVYTVNFIMWDSSKWEISEGNLIVIMKNETWHTLLILHKVYLPLIFLIRLLLSIWHSDNARNMSILWNLLYFWLDINTIFKHGNQMLWDGIFRFPSHFIFRTS